MTVGTHHQGFDRLVRSMDEVAAILDERVLIQRGSSGYRPNYAEHFRFTTSQAMAAFTKEARVVVCHAAAGSIILGLTCNKPLVLVPRLQKFSEAFDDHQLQLARALEKRGQAVAVFEPDPTSLLSAIERALKQRKETGNSARLGAMLRQKLSEWDGI